MFEISQLRYFVVVGEELHFGRAARRLNMTQPPLSRQIQLLEQSLSVQLLERTSRSVKLTPSGRVFLQEAQRLLHQADLAVLTVQRVASGKNSTVRLGFTAASSYVLLPNLIKNIKFALPQIEIVLSEMVTRDQLDALEAGQIDIALVRPPINQRSLRAVKIFTEPLIAAVPHRHRIAAKPKLELKDFSGEPIITYSPVEGRYFHELISEAFRSVGIVPQYMQHVSQTHSILALVSTGIGVALVPQAAQALRIKGVALRSITTEHSFQAELFMAWRHDNPNPSLPLLRDLAFAHLDLKLPVT